ncbi:hypothetical protein [Sphingobium cloacae]|uniref:hypothetical protein n=1 Tax=Sphingobium cloacae TaxID=120107 RepID=UPI000830DB85|nr:hypothetical protein [Sphingobium cloacae]
MTDRLVSQDDAVNIGMKIVEMADRLRDMNKVVTGAQARWGFDMDGVHYDVAVSLGDPAKGSAAG